jgi:hypothetical protein
MPDFGPAADGFCMAHPEGCTLCCGGKRPKNHFHPGQPYSIVLPQAMEGWTNSQGSDKVHHGFERQPGWPT